MMLALFTFVASVLLCAGYLYFARRFRILDRPNERSSHKLPTPHAGGVPLMVALAIGFGLAMSTGVSWPPEHLLLVGIAMVLMLVGVLDDLSGLSMRLRLGCYGLCCLVFVVAVDVVSGSSGLVSWLFTGVAAFSLLWFVNLYNFMDGIDGIAGTQCVLACGGAVLLSPQADNYTLLCTLIGAAHLGFLVLNWPPAKLFMGDAGSIPTGFLLGGLALLASRSGTLPLGCWLILVAPFLLDATWTLLWRLATGQAFTQAHRLHAYQRLSRHWDSHLRVDLLLIAAFVFWLLPLAWAVKFQPNYEILLVILAYLPLIWGMAKIRQFA